MEGLSTISYKGKQIMHANYSATNGSREKTIQLMDDITNEYLKYPPKSALALINITDFHFDKELLNMMKADQDKCTPHIKKVAVIGLKPIHKAAFNFLFAITAGNSLKVLNTELEAKEWLVSD